MKNQKSNGPDKVITFEFGKLLLNIISEKSNIPTIEVFFLLTIVMFRAGRNYQRISNNIKQVQLYNFYLLYNVFYLIFKIFEFNIIFCNFLFFIR